MHALLATTCNAFGMQQLLHCNTHSCDFEAEALVFSTRKQDLVMQRLGICSGSIEFTLEMEVIKKWE